MTGRFLAATALKDVRRQLADPLGLLTWMGLPLVIGGLIVLVSGGEGGTPRGRLLVADEDESLLSGLLGGAAVQGPVAQLFDVTPVDRDEGRRIMDAGDASALVILPAGLQEAVLGEGTAEIRLVTNPSQRILPGMIEEALEIAVELAFYGERLLGGPARRILDGPPGGGDFFSNEAVAELSTAINTRLRELGDTLSPPVLTVEYADPPAAGETDAPQGIADIGMIFLPGMIFMSILFTAQGMSGDVWTEKRLGTLRRAASAPPPMAAVLAGKLLAGGALVGVVAVVGVAVGMLLLDLPPLYAPLAVVWITFAGAVMLSYFVLLQLHASGQQAGNLLSTLVLFPLVMLGGSFFPFEAMPAWMAAIGGWTPNGLALVRLKEIVAGRPDAAGLLAAALGIGLPAAAAFALSVRRLRGGFLVS
jgi:hypothetical protein